MSARPRPLLPASASKSVQCDDGAGGNSRLIVLVAANFYSASHRTRAMRTGRSEVPPLCPMCLGAHPRGSIHYVIEFKGLWWTHKGSNLGPLPCKDWLLVSQRPANGLYRVPRGVPSALDIRTVDGETPVTLLFDKFPSLGGRSEAISQICVVWGKAIAVSHYQLFPHFSNCGRAPAFGMRRIPSALRRRSCFRWRILQAVTAESGGSLVNVGLGEQYRSADRQCEIILPGDGLEFDRRPHRLVQ